jgi:hypothetical protein
MKRVRVRILMSDWMPSGSTKKSGRVELVQNGMHMLCVASKVGASLASSKVAPIGYTPSYLHDYLK